MPPKINGFHAFIALISLWMIIGTGFYDIVGFGRFSILITIVASSLVVFMGRKWLRTSLPRPDAINPTVPWWWRIPLLIIVWSTLLAFVIAWDQRTLMSVRSVWQILPWWWIFFPLISLLCLTSIIKFRSQWFGPLAMFALLPIVLLPVILFPLGAGFDTHLHEATLSLIAQHGVVHPITPYYIGYYVLVILIHSITFIPIVIVHRLLVPVGMAVVLGWVCSLNRTRANAWMIPFVFLLFPIAWATEATPQRFAFVWLILIIFLIASRTPTILVTIAIIATLSIHPITGIPLLGMLIYHTVIGKHSVWIQSMFIAIWILILPMIFIALNATALGTQWTFPSLIPMIQIPQQYNPIFDTLFALVWNKWIVIALMIVIHLRLNPQHARSRLGQHAWGTLIGASLTTAVSGYLVAIIPSFQNVIAYETPDFSHRLYTMSGLFLLPLVIPSAMFVQEHIRTHLTPITQLILATMSLSIIGATIYTFYPIVAEGYRVDKGYTISGSDIEAVQWINNHAPQEAYVVLSNQAVSAAAVKQFGFKHYHRPPGQEPMFYYPIPTGGALYPKYLHYVYTSPSRETIQQAALLSNTNTVFVVINRYWKNSFSLIQTSRRIADAQYSTRDGMVWVFRFNHALQSL